MHRSSPVLAAERNSFALTLYLGPGDIRYLRPKLLASADCDELICSISALSENPWFEEPSFAIPRHLNPTIHFNAGAIYRLVCHLNWADQLRVYHALSKAFFENDMPSNVFVVFQSFWADPDCFPIAECLDSWIKGTESNSHLAASYRESPDYLVIGDESTGVAVFRKTEGVIRRMQELHAEELRRAANQDLEMLRLSSFDTFIYLMEDTRNGAFKIGRSTSPSKREQTLQSEEPSILLRFAIPAEPSHEPRLHSQFASQRVRGEWFSLKAQEILTIVDSLKQHGDRTRIISDLEWLGQIYLSA